MPTYQLPKNLTQYKLPQKWIDYLVNEPETGMGYQIADIHFKKGPTLVDIVIMNCEIFVHTNKNLDINTIDSIVVKQRP